LGFGFLSIMVTRDKAPCRGSGKRVAAPDIVAGNSAHDRTPDATFGQYRRGGKT